MNIITKFSLDKKSVGSNVFKRIFGKIPTLVWGLLACTTIFVGGMIIGYLRGMQADRSGTPAYTFKEENKHLKDVASAYDELTHLYFKQDQDIKVAFNNDILLNHPEEIRDAFQSLSQNRDIINLQLGRILELRRIAGLTDFSGSSYNIK